MMPVRFSTPIRRTRAGSTSWWAPTTFSISPPKAATRTVWRSPCHGCDTTIAILTATSSIPKRCTRSLRAPHRHAARSTSRELLRSHFGQLESPCRSADCEQRSASADGVTEGGAPLSQGCGMDSPRKHSGVAAEMSGVHSRLPRDRKRNRHLNIDRDLSADRPHNPVRGFAHIFCGESRTSQSRTPTGSQTIPKPLRAEKLSIAK